MTTLESDIGVQQLLKAAFEEAVQQDGSDQRMLVNKRRFSIQK